MDSEKNANEITATVAAVPHDLDQDKKKEYDVAAGFLAEIAEEPDADALLAPWTKQEELAVRRKLDRIVLPLIFFSSLMSGTDKVLIGTAVTFGLKTDLNLTANDYSWANSIIYFGCILMVFPESWLCQRFPIAKIYCANVFFYGVTIFGMSGVKNAGGLLATRFVLGMFEGVGHSAGGLLIAMYWKKSEQGWRTAVAFSTLSSVVNGLLSFGMQFYTPGPLSRWRLVFVVMGFFSITVGTLGLIFLPSSPTTAWWMNKRERVIAVRRIAKNNTGMMNHKLKKSQVIEGLLDIKTWLIFLINVTLNIPNGGLIGFNSLIVNSLGYTVKQTTLLAIPTGVISWVASLVFAKLAQKTRQPLLCTIASILICLAAVIMLHVIPRTNKGGSLAALFILYVYWAPYITMGACILYVNVAGMSKKIVVFGITYIGYCVGNLIAPQTFLGSEAPGYPTAIIVMLVGYCVSILLILLYGYLCYRDNKKKEIQQREWEEAHPDSVDGVGEEWKDLTDKENPFFRYTY